MALVGLCFEVSKPSLGLRRNENRRVIYSGFYASASSWTVWGSVQRARFRARVRGWRQHSVPDCSAKEVHAQETKLLIACMSL